MSKTTFVFQVNKYITPTMSILVPYNFVNLENTTNVTQNVLANLHIHVHVYVCFCYMCFTRLGSLTELKRIESTMQQQILKETVFINVSKKLQ